MQKLLDSQLDPQSFVVLLSRELDSKPQVKWDGCFFLLNNCALELIICFPQQSWIFYLETWLPSLRESMCSGVLTLSGITLSSRSQVCRNCQLLPLLYYSCSFCSCFCLLYLMTQVQVQKGSSLLQGQGSNLSSRSQVRLELSTSTPFVLLLLFLLLPSILDEPGPGPERK